MALCLTVALLMRFFIVRQLQEKHLAANKPLYMAFVDLEKAFDRVPRDVIWWAMCKLGIDEWLVRLDQFPAVCYVFFALSYLPI